MNERIKEIMFQSGLGYMSSAHLLNLPSLVEKFAELIVAECIQTIQMGITRDGHNTEQYLRSVKHIKQIKEHFGVKE